MFLVIFWFGNVVVVIFCFVKLCVLDVLRNNSFDFERLNVRLWVKGMELLLGWNED